MSGERNDSGKAQSWREAADSAAANERNRRLESGERNVPSQEQMGRIYRDSLVKDEKRRERK